MGVTSRLASASQPQPQRRGPAIKVKRYGRNDFERFDEEAARGPHLCVGSATIGKVDIDCKYHWKKAQWGVLGIDKTPAGIIFMDITFKQPHGYWLERANVFITLSEDMSSYALSAPHHARFQPVQGLNSEYAVQITDYYGPRILTGTKTVVAEAKHNEFVPAVKAMGFEFGGLGRKSSTFRDRIGRWVFKGTVCRPKDRAGLRTLEWELSENVLDPEQIHNQTYHTAFAFEHSKRPVFMRVEVEGKLRGRTRQMKHGLLKFSSTFGKKDNSTLTELELSRHVWFEKSLDHIAEGLDLAMQMENYEKLPIEVPDPTPAQFIADAATGRLAGQTQRPQPPEQHPAAPEPWEEDDPQEELEENLELQGQESSYIEDSATDPILESLRRQLQVRVGSDLAPHINVHGTTNKAPEPADESDGSGTAVNSTSPSAPATLNQTPVAIDRATLELVKIPALLMLLKLLATMLQWFSRTQQTLQAASGSPEPKPPRQEQVDDTKLLEGPSPGPLPTDQPWTAREAGRQRRSAEAGLVPPPAAAIVEGLHAPRRGARARRLASAVS